MIGSRVDQTENEVFTTGIVNQEMVIKVDFSSTLCWSTEINS